MDFVRFEHSEYLFGLLLILLFVILFVMRMIASKKAIKKFGDTKLVLRLIRNKPKYKRQLKFILIILAFASIVFALANLQFGSKIEKVKTEGVDIVLAIDLSSSMMAEDIKPNRLERTKHFINQLLDKISNHRIGIVVFAGNAYVQMPLTIDYPAAKLFLYNLNTKMIPTQGTAIGNAIKSSNELFETRNNKYKTIIIFSDGENHEGNAVENAKEAYKDGVIIHTVGVGTAKGAPVPIYRGNEQVDFKRDKEGSIILSKIDDAMLQEISAVSGGEYYKITNSGDNLKALLKKIDSQEKREIDSHMVTDYESKFQYFLALGLFFLILEFFIFERKSNWKLNLNNFKLTSYNE